MNNDYCYCIAPPTLELRQTSKLPRSSNGFETNTPDRSNKQSFFCSRSLRIAILLDDGRAISADTRVSVSPMGPKFAASLSKHHGTFELFSLFTFLSLPFHFSCPSVF